MNARIRVSRGLLAAVALLVAALLVALPQHALGAARARSSAAAKPLAARLSDQLRAAGGIGAGLAVDLQTRRTIWAVSPTRLLTPASVTKLFTTSAVLLKLGPDRRFSTAAVRQAEIGPDGVLVGNLWLKGAGDPSLGHSEVAALADRIKAAGLKSVTGSVLGDEGLFDRNRGTPILGGGFNWDIGGALSALAFDHGESARTAAVTLTLALRHRGIKVPKGHVGVGAAPGGTATVARVLSPKVSTLITWTNRPSDNFYAETLLKDLGAYGGSAGTTKEGLRVEAATLGGMGLKPRLFDGSGLSHSNKVRATDVANLLAGMAGNPTFTGSLAVAGRSGTLAGRMRRGSAAGRCSGKTGTLSGVTSLAGYCPVAKGGKLAFVILMSGTSASKGRPRQDRIVQALARWARPAGW